MPLVFVKAPVKGVIASQLLRLDQMHEMLSQNLGHPVAINTVTQPSILVFSKMATMCMGDLIKRLLDEGVHYLVSDMVDYDLYNHELFDAFHAHIAAGFELAEKIKTKTSRPVFVIPHGLDQRLYALNFTKTMNWQMGYIGLPDNTKWSERFDVSMYDSYKDKNWAAGVRDASCHWCIRKEINRLKPFTKGVLAGFTKSPAIFLRGDSDSNYWLDEDYPLLCDDTEDSVRTAVDYAKSAWNTPKWSELIDPLIEAHERVIPAKLSQCYFEMIHEIEALEPA